MARRGGGGTFGTSSAMPAVGAPAAGTKADPPDITKPYQYTEDFLNNRTRVTYTVDGKRTVGTGPNVTVYDEQAALGLMGNLKRYEGAIDELKRDLWWAGFYGSSEPAVGGDVFDRNDLQALYMAMDQAELNGGLDVVDLVSSMAQAGRTRNGPLGQTVDPEDDPAFAMKSLAQSNGIQLSDGFIASRVASVASGETTLQQELERIRSTFVKNAYPAWADEISSGSSMEDIAAPYKAAMARMLEIPEDAISLNDKTLKSALQAAGSDGKPTYQPLWLFEQNLRKDPRWQYTDNAYQQVLSAHEGALREMGF